MLENFKELMQRLVYLVFDPLVGLVRKIGITPNNITTLGFLLSIVASAYLVYPMFDGHEVQPSRLFGFGWILFASGLLDMLDGRMARLYELKSTFGAFYDSVMDRYSELIMFLGLMAFFISHGNWLMIFITFWAMCGSLMVSYARARAEGLNVDCSVGLLQRPERLSLIVWTCWIAGFVSNNYETITLVGLGLVAILANFTAFQRMWHVKSQVSKGLNR